MRLVSNSKPPNASRPHHRFCCVFAIHTKLLEKADNRMRIMHLLSLAFLFHATFQTDDANKSYFYKPKRSQQFNATYMYIVSIVGRNMLLAFGQVVVTCCNTLNAVCSILTIFQTWKSDQTIAKCQPYTSQHCWAEHVGPFGSNFISGQIWANTTQNVATRRNRGSQTLCRAIAAGAPSARYWNWVQKLQLAE